MKTFKIILGLGMMLLLANAALAQEWAGKITEAQGQVTIVRSGQTLVSKLGSGVMAGDVVTTCANSRAKIWFRDESVITLSEKSRFRVDALDYSPGVSRKSMYTLVAGKAKALVSGWFGNNPEQQYQIRALSTVAGVRGTEFIVQINGDGADAKAFFATISGTVVLWNVDRPQQKLTLPADFFIEVENGAIPGGKQALDQQFLNQLNQGFWIMEAQGLRGEIIMQVVQINVSMPGGPGGPVVINVIPMPGEEFPEEDVQNPTESMFSGEPIVPYVAREGGGGGIIIPAGNTQIKITIDTSNLIR